MIYGIFAWNPKYGRQRFSASGQFLATLKRSSHRFWGNLNMNADPPDELTFNSFDSCYSRFMSIISVLWIIAIPPDVVTRVKCDVEILNICNYVTLQHAGTWLKCFLVMQSCIFLQTYRKWRTPHGWLPPFLHQDILEVFDDEDAKDGRPCSAPILGRRGSHLSKLPWVLSWTQLGMMEHHSRQLDVRMV